MAGFIELERRFRELSGEELAEAERRGGLDDFDRLFDAPWFDEAAGATGWDGVLERPRVVLLAGAGSGKTVEMRERARRLAGEGRFAFFVALHDLDREPLGQILSRAEEERFEDWKQEAAATAWFFLDAVDELKLAEGVLDRALRRLSRDLDGRLDRARVVVSSRPSDWRPGADMETFERWLPIPPAGPAAPLDAPPARTAEEAFLAPLRQDAAPAPPEDGAKGDSAAPAGFATVVLQPLDRGRIARFAEARGAADAAAFLEEVQRRDAWVFARRPLDLADLLGFWRANGRLGTRAEQHEANIANKLADDPERRDKDALSADGAREGAEQLALALALARGRTFRVPDREPDDGRADGALDPAAVLPDWTPAQAQSLLRRALFDPATFGRVRFHHRSVEEYLAAKRLQRLRKKGMRSRELRRLSFGECYGERIVFPAMRPVVAWLALWDDDTRREALEREPELLLDHGDPESLPLAERECLLRRYAAMYGKGGWRGVGPPFEQVRRLAHRDLAPTIRELWDAGPENAEVRDLLMDLVREGPIAACADIARDAALDAGQADFIRSAGIQAVAACGRHDYAREIVETMLADQTSWPKRTQYAAVEAFFPKILSVDGLISLIKRTRQPDNYTDDLGLIGFGRILRQNAEAIDPVSDLAVELRNKLASLIQRGLGESPRIYRLQGTFDRLGPALARLCGRQVPTGNGPIDANLIRACVIASRCGREQVYARGAVEDLRRHFAPGSPHREEAFRAELAFVDEIAPDADDRVRLNRVCLKNGGLIPGLEESDRAWLEAALRDEGEPERRPVLLQALIGLWRQRGGDRSELPGIRAMLKDAAALEALLEKRTAPPDPESVRRSEKSKARIRQSAERARKKEKTHLDNWKNWRKELIGDPADAFSPENAENTMYNIWLWLDHRPRPSGTRDNKWNKPALVEAFGAEVADCAEAAFKAFWRSVTPLPPSMIGAESRNKVYNWELWGLCGVYIEAATPGWSRALSPDEARAAALYATVEIDGFPPFLGALAETHPCEVEAAIGPELADGNCLSGEAGHHWTLYYLSGADNGLKRLLAPRLIDALREWPRAVEEANARQSANNLETLLKILDEGADDEGRRTMAAECAERYRGDPTGPLFSAWLGGFFRFDPKGAADSLTETLAGRDDLDVHDHAIQAFACLSRRYDGVGITIDDCGRHAQALGKLLRAAYAFVRPEDDPSRDGARIARKIDARDKAQDARRALLSSLMNTPGPETHRIVLELAEEPDFAGLSDRMRHLARQRAAADGETPPLSAEEVAALEQRLEAPPRGRDALFEVTMDRLEDIAHDIRHGDFNPRERLGKIDRESEIQNEIAERLRNNANGAYTVGRESEVADRNRPDIQLTAADGAKAAIEVKIADNWTLRELEKALESQLVEKYLRAADRRAGCLLLVRRGAKNGWRRERGGRAMDFAETVAHLDRRAREIERDRAHETRLAASGLDLAPPPAAAATSKAQ